MKIVDYLFDNRIRQITFAKEVGVTRCHLSAVITGKKKAGKRLAASIHRATNGMVSLEDVRNGKAIGSELTTGRVVYL